MTDDSGDGRVVVDADAVSAAAAALAGGRSAILSGFATRARVERFAALCRPLLDGRGAQAAVSAATFAQTHPGLSLVDILPGPAAFQLLQRMLGPDYVLDHGCILAAGAIAASAAPGDGARALAVWLPLSPPAAPGPDTGPEAPAPVPGDVELRLPPVDSTARAQDGVLLQFRAASFGMRPGRVQDPRRAALETACRGLASLGSRMILGRAEPAAAGDLILAAARLMQRYTPAQVLPLLRPALRAEGLIPEGIPAWAMPEAAMPGEVIAGAATSRQRGPALPAPRSGDIALCMSVRNHAHLVDRALDGFARQERPFDQIVLIDDGSDDATFEHLSRFAAGRPEVQVRRNPSAIGAIASIRAAEPLLRTDYLACAAADDLLLPNAAARLAEAAAVWPQAGVVLGETGVTNLAEIGTGRIGDMGHGGHRTSDLPSFLAPEAVPTVLACRRLSFGTAWMARRDALAAIGGFDAGFGPLSDFHAAVTLSFRHGIAVVPERLSVMTVDAASYSRSTGSDAGAMTGIRDRLLQRIKSPENADVYAGLAATPSLAIDLQAGAELFTTYFAWRPQHWDLMLRTLRWALRHGEMSIGRGS